MKKGSKYITLTQRRQIEAGLSMGMNKKEIAEHIGMSVRTVYRELKRGLCTQRKKVYDIYGDYNYKDYTAYSADIAEDKFRLNMTSKGAPLKVGNDYDFIRYVEKRVLDNITPCAIVGEIKRNRSCKTVVSKTTMYRYISIGLFMNIKMCHLPFGSRVKHYRKAIAKRAPKGTSIEKRSAEITARNSFGHWEMDCVIGKQGTRETLLTFTERLTRFEIVYKMPDHKAATVVHFVNKLEKRYGKLFHKIFKSITVDNGVEFSDFDGLEKSIYGGKRLNVYYCHPYTSCERGTNERLNRDIRRKFPKGTDFAVISDRAVQACENWVNDYPREIFGFATAAEKFNEQLQAI